MCKDKESYFAVLCSDIQEVKYVVVKISDEELYCLLHGALAMRDVFTKQNGYWEIISGEEIGSDVITYKSMEDIDYSVLPEDGACFEVLTDEVSSYVKKFDESYLLKVQFETLVPICDFNENILNVVYEDSPEFVKRFVGLYEGQSNQKISVGSRSTGIDYGESMNDILKPNTILSEKNYSEEWKSAEMKILAYAA